jgi:hypothetical protein
MLLRRIAEHVKAQNWFAVAIDFVIVVAGVFIGLQVQDWNTAQQTRAKADLFTARLIDDLRYEAWAYESLVQYHYDIRANARRATDSLTGGEVLTDEQFLIAAYRASQFGYNERRRAAYDELVSTGAMDLIAGQEIRATAVSVFTNPVFDMITEGGRNSEYRRLFRATTPADVQAALLVQCGDRLAEPGDYAAIVDSLDYPCALDLPRGKIQAAAAALRAEARFLPTLQLQFADTETAIQLLESTNRTMRENLRDITEAAP